MHVLTQVRSAVVTALTGLPTTGAKVFTQRPYAWQPEQLPNLLVVTAADPVVEQLDHPPVLRWDIVVSVIAAVHGTGDLAVLMDQISSEVQVALCSVGSIAGKIVQVIPQSFEPIIFSGEGDQPVANRGITFLVQSLYTSAIAPDILLD